jgi:hypothetical protein
MAYSFEVDPRLGASATYVLVDLMDRVTRALITGRVRIIGSLLSTAVHLER